MQKKIKCLSIILLIILLWGCGKKTSPTLKSYEPPRPIESINAVRIEDDLIISWAYPSQDVKKIKSFIITIKSDDGEETKILSPDSSTFKFNKIKDGKIYLYEIKAVNKKGIESTSKQKKAVICNMPKGKPTARFNIKGDSLLLAWDPLMLESQPEGCSQRLVYNLYRFEDINNPVLITINDKPINKDQIAISLDANKTNYYAVRPAIEGDTLNIGPMSDPLKISPDMLIPASPIIHSINKSNNRVFIMWYETDANWVKAYRVYKKVQNDDFKLIAEVLTPVFTEEIDDNKKTYYKITAVGPLKEGMASEILEIK